MSGLEVRTIQYRDRMSYCDGLPEVSRVKFWETLEATELFLSKHIDTTDVKKKAHTQLMSPQPTQMHSEISQNLGENY